MKYVLAFGALLILFSWNTVNNSTFTVAFYNVENLFDTLDNPHIRDEEFTPTGKNLWDAKKYKKKLTHIAEVIQYMGDQDGPELMGLCEIENKQVLEDLVREPLIANKNYGIIHFDSKDERGVDVALLYKKNVFTPTHSTTYSASLEKLESHSRDILLVTGTLGKETIHILVNHWPSRRAGTEQTRHKRIAMALVAREAIDSILQKEPQAKIIVMGDFNDEPVDESLKTALLARSETKDLKEEELYNPFYALKEQGLGTIKHQHYWILFDQILVSKSLVYKEGLKYMDLSATIFHPEWLHYEGVIKNGPARTYMGNKYKGGYSDHFPVYIRLKKK